MSKPKKFCVVTSWMPKDWDEIARMMEETGETEAVRSLYLTKEFLTDDAELAQRLTQSFLMHEVNTCIVCLH